MKRFFVGLCVLAMVSFLYLTAWPVPVAPVAWAAKAAPGYSGPHAVNTRLANLQTISIGDEVGPEHIAIGPDGKLYAAVASGNILRMNPDGSDRQVFANTGGRVLGFDFDARGNLIAADAMRGLLSIGADGKVAVLTDKVGDEPIRYADGIVVSKAGPIYFTDASRRFGPKENGGTFEASVLDILEQQATGRVLVYDPSAKTTRTVAGGLAFANGIALSADERTLFVNETGKYRIWKIPASARDLDLSGGEAGGAKILFDNLPGYPDNLMRGRPGPDGKLVIWCGFAKPRNPSIDGLADKPFLRSVVLRLPRALWPIPKVYGHVFAFTEDGTVVNDLQDPTGAYPETTGVTETSDRLYIQSLHAHSIGWLKKP